MATPASSPDIVVRNVRTCPLPSGLVVYDDGDKLVYHNIGLPPCRDLVTEIVGTLRDTAIETVRRHCEAQDPKVNPQYRHLNRIHWLTRDGTQITYTPEIPPGKTW